jgi:hypothetical protein
VTTVSYLKIAVVACRVVMTCHDHHPTIAPLWFARVENAHAHAEATRPITKPALISVTKR